MTVLDVFPWVLLRILHGIYHPVNKLVAVLPRRLNPIHARIPAHLALNLVTITPGGEESDAARATGSAEAIIECAVRVIGWCREVGVQKLTVYDRHGVLKSHHEEFLAQLHIAHSNISVTPVHQPLPDTPPPSEHSSTTSFEIDQDADVGVISWVISAPLPGSAPDADDADVPVGERTGLRKRQAGETETEDAESVSQGPLPLQVYVASYSDGRPAIARAARTLALPQTSQPSDVPFELRVQDLSDLLENELPSPNLMIVHHLYPTIPLPPLELDAYPPWQLRLTEFSQSPFRTSILSSFRKTGVVIEEEDFKMSLHEFATAEFREGK